MYLGPTKKACEVTDETLIKCMKDYLENPERYHPEYLEILMKDYERRVVYKMEAPAPPPRTTVCSNMTNITV
jgi:hypothetical protein